MIIMVDGNACRTKDNRSMVEDVDDIVICAQFPDEEGLGQQIYNQ